MKLNLFKRYFLFVAMIASFAAITVACSSEDTDAEEPEVIGETPDEPSATADPTNENTTITATAAALVDNVSTSTVTVQLAEADGSFIKTSAGTVLLTATGGAVVSDITDNGDGTYSATITNDNEENVVISGTVDGTAITSTANITFNPDNSNPAQGVAQSTVPLGPSLIRINSGGPEVTYGDITFLEDQYFDVENTISFNNPFVTEIAGTEMDDIFLTERITADGMDIRGPFSYNIPVTNGTYSVRLYFAEIYWGLENPQGFEGDEGKRIFNAKIEDVEIFTGYDLVKDVNPAIASTRMYDIEVTDGILTIIFEASVNKPKISAIEVLGTGSVGN